MADHDPVTEEEAEEQDPKPFEGWVRRGENRDTAVRRSMEEIEPLLPMAVLIARRHAMLLVIMDEAGEMSLRTNLPVDQVKSLAEFVVEAADRRIQNKEEEPDAEG